MLDQKPETCDVLDHRVVGLGVGEPNWPIQIRTLYTFRGWALYCIQSYCISMHEQLDRGAAVIL